MSAGSNLDHCSWLHLNATDPDGTLEWFIAELDKAEKAGDKVWILGHIPNEGAQYSWSKIYYDAINRSVLCNTGININYSFENL